MSFIPPILRFFNVIPSKVLEENCLIDKQILGTQTKTTSIVLLILQYLKILPSNQKALENETLTRPVTPEPVRKTKVWFKQNAGVLLIPTKEEYYEAYGESEDSDKLVGDMIWYTKEEKKFFLDEATVELESLVKANGITLQEAQNILYQPDPEAIAQSTWDNRRVKEMCIGIFKIFRKRTIHLEELNVQPLH